MFICILFHIVNSMYPLHFIDGQPYIQLDTDLSPQIKIDQLLSQFIYRNNGNCPIYEKDCFQEIQTPDGTIQTIRLDKESFNLYDIQQETHDTETIIYSNQPLEQEQYSYLALGPYQSHINSFQMNGFNLCLSKSDGFINTNYNAMTQSPDKTQGILNRLTQNKYTSYGLNIQNMEFSYKIHDITNYPIYIIQDDWIVLPENEFPEYYFKEKGFNYDQQSNLYIREHIDDDLQDILFYNQVNQENPLIVSSQNYIYNEDGLDVLKIITMKEYNNVILLGMPFIKDKIISVQTVENYIFVEQLKYNTCILGDESMSGWTIFFIILQVILLPLLIYFTFKKLRSNQERKQQQTITNYNLHTELQQQQL